MQCGADRQTSEYVEMTRVLIHNIFFDVMAIYIVWQVSASDLDL